MTGQLFEYAVFLNPTTDEAKDGTLSKLILGPKQVLAANDKAVQLQAARELPEDYADRLHRIEVAIRPF